MHLISMQDQAMTRHLLGTDEAPTRLIFDPSILLTTTLQKGRGSGNKGSGIFQSVSRFLSKIVAYQRARK